MAGTAAALTANSTVGDWLDHPEGGQLLRGLLAQSGMDADRLTPVRGFALQQLVELSQGAVTQDVVDDLVLRANGGVAPEDTGEVAGWRERIVPGRFDGRTVVVTGAASGIGRATASRIAREGGTVVAVDLAAEPLQALADELGERVTPVVGDITRVEDVERIVAAANGQVHGLANVAGVADDFTPVHEVSDAVWERCFRVNVDGSFRLMRAVLPAMLAAGRGSIVNVASEAALRGSAAGAAYTASKHAVVGLTRSAAFMYGPQGIRVNAVAPGGVATGMRPTSASEFGQGRIAPLMALIPPVATAEQLAASITFLLSDDGVNLNGAILPSDGGWSVQ
ncbi:SDR family NAD(P)-dependent oxidoreductase [Modestobacter sp. VKM Ac-2985]|uniref:SDR family NAD(P)-dependent oxidoreductase n=1 Tax=Modestobacter sp. VKM Ac-2985 TaxID=3004139 RepID=UPI0022AB87DD|nr:SDR family NAD(P)-dependent oxidoreductase [Modestobacter sp. VKM Ac-2985]MCZ2840142.1 SDR family NAD(P)-dependent oxidoreductase [Modestobacter sp. VKM Ac-2985]